MTKKIVLVPLDERPCNYRFPLLMPRTDFELVVPPIALLGLKKTPSDTEKLAAWLLDNAVDADAFVLSLDELIYGGLIPSRLHHLSAETLISRGRVVEKLKQLNSTAKIYAFQTIMRCPFYSLSEEEPDYYANYGSQICMLGKLIHKKLLGALSEEDKAELDRLEEQIPQEVVEDFETRRNTNLQVLFATLQMVQNGVIDGFVCPQDDSAPLGYTAMDQLKVTTYVKQHGLQLKVPIYPAADDTGMTLLCRAVNELNQKKPKIYVYYASPKGATVVPAFEDRIVDATVTNQILAAGCRRVFGLNDCDIFLAINIGSAMPYQPTSAEMRLPYDVERSLAEYIDQIECALELGKVVAVADVAYPSNSDLEMLKLLQQRDLLLKIHAYAGWNTSSNTLGTVICQSCLYFLGKDERANKEFLLHRYYDDVGYCSHTRTFIDETAVPQNNCTVFVLDGQNGKCVAAAEKELLKYMSREFPTVSQYVEDVKMFSIWNRTFEMDIVLKYKNIQ